MAASFNDPKITNQIASDVPAIQQLLGYLAQARPDLGANYPDGSIRISEWTTNRWAIQYYRDASWHNMPLFDIDVIRLQGHSVSESATSGAIPVYNASGQLVGNITGTAATATKLATARSIQCGGIASSTAQNFDGSANITIPINQITVNNSADNALNGTVTKAHGGTGRTDGAAADVIVSGISGEFFAKSKGQIGQAIVLANKTNANSVVERGLYIFQGNEGVEENLPISLGGTCFMDVFHQGNYIEQIIHASSTNWYRYSINKGASFGKWIPISGNYEDIVIFVSKSGSDLNSGLNSSYPVLTIGRALEVGKGLCGGGPNAHVTICLGAGNWGNINIMLLPFILTFCPYDGGTPTQYSASLPVFDSIFVDGGGDVNLQGVIVQQRLHCRASLCVINAGYKRYGTIAVSDGGNVRISSGDASTNILEFVQYSSTGNIAIYDGGQISFGENITLKLGANITANQFLFLAGGGRLICSSIYSIAVETGSYTFTGSKYYLAYGADISGYQDLAIKQFLERLPGTGGTLDGTASINGRSIAAALDSAVVHKASNDIITGSPIFQNSHPFYKNTTDSKDVAPDVAQRYEYFNGIDKDGKTVCTAQVVHYPSGTMDHLITLYGQDGSSENLVFRKPVNGNFVFYFPTPPAADNSTTGATTAWVRTLVASNSANEVPIGTICAYEGAFTRAIDAAVFFEKEIKSLSESLKNEQQAARMMRQTRSADEDIGLIFELQELENKIFQLEYWKEFYREMLSRVPENDGVTLYNAEGNPIDETVAYPEFQIMGRAFPNTKWNQYSPGARVLIGEDANMGTSFTYGKSGGDINHTHSTSGSLGSTTLTTSNIPSHTHKTRDGGSADSYASNNGRLIRSDYGFNTETDSKGSSSSHTHSLTLNATGSASSYPPYKVVYWIKKVA